MPKKKDTEQLQSAEKQEKKKEGHDHYIFNAVTESWVLEKNEDVFCEEVARLAKAARNIDPKNTDDMIQKKLRDFLSDFVEINFGNFIEETVRGMSRFIEGTMTSEVELSDKEQNKFLVDAIVKRHIKGDPRQDVRHTLTNGRQAILYSYGVNIIVMELLPNYNPEKASAKASFTTYMSGNSDKDGETGSGKTLKNKIINEYVKANKESSNYHYEKQQQIARAQDYLREHGKDPTSIPEIMEQTGLTEKVIKQEMELKEYNVDIMGRNRYVKNEEGNDVDIISDDTHEVNNVSGNTILPTDEEYSREEKYKVINSCIKQLSRPQQMAFCLGYLYHPSFLLGFDRVRVKETANELGDYELGFISGMTLKEITDMKEDWEKCLCPDGEPDDEIKKQIDEMTHTYMLKSAQEAIDKMDEEMLQHYAIEMCKTKKDKKLEDNDLIRSQSGAEKQMRGLWERLLIGMDTRIISITGLTKTQYKNNLQEALRRMKIMLAESGLFKNYVKDYDVRTEKIGKIPIAEWPSDDLLNGMLEEIMNTEIDWSDME